MFSFLANVAFIDDKMWSGCEPPDVVHNTFEAHREYGGYTDPSKKRTGLPKILDDDDESYLKSLSESNPSIYLDGIIEKFEAIYGIFVLKAIIFAVTLGPP